MGSLEVIAGCMFSGKTEELIREVRRAVIAKQKAIVFDHTLDDARYGNGTVNSHSGLSYETFSVNKPSQILSIVKKEKPQIVAIDEAQFFGDLLSVCEQMADSGIRVIVAGLNTDFRGEPFGAVPELMARADHIRLLTAICNHCGRDATRTQRLIDGKPAPYRSKRIVVGGTDAYQARCRECHEVPGKKR